MQSLAAELSVLYMHGPCCYNLEYCGILQFVLLVLPGCDPRLSRYCDMQFQAPFSHSDHI